MQSPYFLEMLPEHLPSQAGHRSHGWIERMRRFQVPARPDTQSPASPLWSMDRGNDVANFLYSPTTASRKEKTSKLFGATAGGYQIVLRQVLGFFKGILSPRRVPK